jgi:hypothetical protein
MKPYGSETETLVAGLLDNAIWRNKLGVPSYGAYEGSIPKLIRGRPSQRHNMNRFVAKGEVFFEPVSEGEPTYRGKSDVGP